MAEINFPTIPILDFIHRQNVVQGDRILLTSSQGSGYSISVQMLVEYLLKATQPSVSDEGTLVIGETDTKIKLAESAEIYYNSDLRAICYSKDGRQTFTVLATLNELKPDVSKFTAEQLAQMKLKYSDLTDEDKAELQKPALDVAEQMNTLLTQAQTAVDNAKNAVTEAEEATSKVKDSIEAAQTAVTEAKQAVEDANTAAERIEKVADNAKEVEDAAEKVQGMLEALEKDVSGLTLLRLTQEEYDAIKKKEYRFYAIMDGRALDSLYFGVQLLLKRSQKIEQGFDYTFPLVF